MKYAFNPFTSEFDAIGSGLTGPASTTDNSIVRWDGTNGKMVQSSTVFISDGGDLGVAQRTAFGNTAIIGGTTIFESRHAFENTITDFSASTLWSILTNYVTPNSSVNITGKEIYAFDNEINVPTTSTKNYGVVSAEYTQAVHGGSGTVTSLIGKSIYTWVDGGSVTHLNCATYASWVNTGSSAVVTDNYCLTVKSGHNGAGGSITEDATLVIKTPYHVQTLTTHYGLEIEDQAFGTTSYAIFSNGGRVYIKGFLGLGSQTAPLANIDVTQAVVNAGSPRMLLLTGAVNTAITASTEVPSVDFNFNQTKQWATGAVSLHREVLIQAPTIAFVGASTATDVATVGITGAPAKGTNATLTNTHALLISAGAVSTATSSYGLTVNAQTGGTSNYAAQFLGGFVGIGLSAPVATLDITQAVATTGSPTAFRVTGGAHTTLTASAEAIAINFATNQTVQFATGALATQRTVLIQAPTYGFAGASTLTTAVTLDVTGAPSSGANATILNPSVIRIGAAASYISNANTSYRGLFVSPHTITFTGGVAITATVPNFGIGVGVLTLTSASSTTIANAASLYINNQPAAGGSVTITNSYAFWVDAGATRFDGRVMYAKGADIASANDLTLGTDGNTFGITGTTTINAITTANWLAGSHVTLIFAAATTVKHNTAGSGGTAKMFLAGSADLTTALNTVLGLVYDGTQWQETFRKVA